MIFFLHYLLFFVLVFFIFFFFCKKKFFYYSFIFKLKFINLLKLKKFSIIVVDVHQMKLFNLFYSRKEGNNLLKVIRKNLQNKFGLLNVYHIFGDKFIIVTKKDIDLNKLSKMFYNKKYLFKFNKEKNFLINLNIFKIENNNFLKDIKDIEEIIEINKKNNIINISANNINHIQNDKLNKKNNYIKYKKIIDDSIDKENNYNFCLFKQAIATKKNIKNNSFNHFELLIRIYDKKNNIYISPFQFLDIIFNSSILIKSFNEKLFDLVVDICNNNPYNNYHINISNSEISNDDILFNIINNLKKIINKNIVIEFLETEKLDYSNKNFILLVDYCNKNFIKLAIDDFGSGYSNFSYLSQFKIDFVKIDGEIIKKINEEKTYNLLKLLISFCNINGIKTVAEYVENKEIYNNCKNLGFDYFQGFYHHKPELEN